MEWSFANGEVNVRKQKRLRARTNINSERKKEKLKIMRSYEFYAGFRSVPFYEKAVPLKDSILL